jgi:S-adenosylmethionine:tRNA ribosyltransferase-isomerase
MKRLLVIDPLTRRLGDYRLEELPQLLGPGDVVVVNDAATLPASLRVDDELELRLVSAHDDGSFLAVAFGSGDFRRATEARGTPRRLREGERLKFSEQLAARVVGFDPTQPRLVRLRFETSGAEFWSALYRHASPIQYAYAQQPYALWDVQNVYAARPWAFEPPSAGRPLTFETLFEIERRGATLTYLTHAAGISSTGDAAFDARFPLPERYEIGAAAAQAVTHAGQGHGRVLAVGTSVVRALESHSDAGGTVAAGGGISDLRLSARHRPRVVDGLLTGLHEPGSSHFELLETFAPRALLERAVDHAQRTGYVAHELGDSCLILGGALLEQLAA